LAPGWRCLDVGAGGGSIARWLSEQVSPTGHVLATDLNTDALESLAGPSLTVERHDIARDPLPEAAFDLIHTRLVLIHLPEREEVLARLFTALHPDGWLVAEEFDARSMLPDASINPAETETPLLLAIQQALRSHGADPQFGRRIVGLLRQLDFRDVDAEGRILFFQGGSAGASLHRRNAALLRDEIIGSGAMTAGDLDREVARLDDPDFMVPSPIMWTVWGRKPRVEEATQ
jgi:SAM-dependent methyltransferase